MNVHVLIGRNGVGKTRVLNSLLRSLVAADQLEGAGIFEWAPSLFREDEADFANVVNVSFSAFDVTELFAEKLHRRAGQRRYAYVGLRQPQNSAAGQESPERESLKTHEELTQEFADSIAICAVGDRQRRWREAIGFLENDFGLSEQNLPSLMEEMESDVRRKLASDVFRSLSSGHKIVLLTITRLVETVEEKTLVLLDEPEAHLHPPLLSAFIRALSNLLSDRNGVAIIATHSPVVLQEVPRVCVKKLVRFGEETSADPPLRETFGENVGVLTHETFGLELVNTGFYRLLKEATEMQPTLESAIQAFDGALGDEAKAVLRALYLNKVSEGQQSE